MGSKWVFPYLRKLPYCCFTHPEAFESRCKLSIFVVSREKRNILYRDYIGLLVPYSLLTISKFLC